MLEIKKYQMLLCTGDWEILTEYWELALTRGYDLHKNENDFIQYKCFTTSINNNDTEKLL